MPPRVFSIPPGAPFLATLARSILDGRAVEGFRYDGDPLALAGVTIYLPTRRAARSLAAVFAAELAGGAAILPAIRTLGEAGDEQLFGPADGPLPLRPVMDVLQRRLLVARLVHRWKQQLTREIARALDGEEMVPPASPADALWLARDLCGLLDEVESDGASLGGLTGLAPERLAHWWQLTLAFLQILTEQWPAILAERGLVDEARARNEALLAEAARLARDGSPGPVIVAGSTASAPAVVELMRAVAGLPNGALVLPGLDRDLDPTDFAAIDVARSPATPGHPQHGLKTILQRLLVPREAVTCLAPELPPALRARERFVSDTLRPAETTDRWGEPSSHPDEALDGLALVEAADEREEALAIAVAMREALGDPHATVALTTPDRSLARRVVAELMRFGIMANDSAGRPLAATAPGTLLSLVAEAALRPGDPITLIALLKHPLARFGFSAAEARRAARTLEMLALRGGVGTADAALLAELYARRRSAAEAPEARTPRPVRLIPAADRDLAAEVAQRLQAALLPLTGLRGAAPMEIPALAEALTRALEAVAGEPGGGAGELYAGDAGAALAAFLSGLVQCPSTGFEVPPEELPAVLTALFAGETVRPRGGLSARAFVWGALESRLQSVDVAILGGLNEGTWPVGARSDAFLSRMMRGEIKLDPPERRIGLAAHDVSMLLGAKRVVITRSERAGGAPTVASRWLQRLLAVAKPEGAARIRREGEVYLAHARGLDDAAEGIPLPPPAPRPPLAARPVRLSVTEVERLIRDPYAFYAHRVLRLEPLPELLRDPGAADRGNLYHRILARFVDAGIDPAAPDAEARLLGLAREAFAEEALPPEVEAIWWPRMESLAASFIAWERERQPRVAARIAECRGELPLPDLATTLTGYADRIDRMRDGSVEIVDFKTGTQPSVAQARTLLAPQLPLEGAMARHGAFPAVGAVNRVAELSYVRLREREFYEEALSCLDRKTGDVLTGDGLSDAALAKLRALVAAYRDEARPYASRLRPLLAGDFTGEYDHLARAREWSAGSDEEAGEPA